MNFWTLKKLKTQKQNKKNTLKNTTATPPKPLLFIYVSI